MTKDEKLAAISDAHDTVKSAKQAFLDSDAGQAAGCDELTAFNDAVKAETMAVDAPVDEE